MPINRQEIEQKIIAIIAEKLDKPASEIALNADLEKELGVDSLERADILFSVEDEYGIEEPLPQNPYNAKSYRTIKDLADYIAKQLETT